MINRYAQFALVGRSLKGTLLIYHVYWSDLIVVLMLTSYSLKYKGSLFFVTFSESVCGCRDILLAEAEDT